MFQFHTFSKRKEDALRLNKESFEWLVLRWRARHLAEVGLKSLGATVKAWFSAVPLNHESNNQASFGRFSKTEREARCWHETRNTYLLRLVVTFPPVVYRSQFDKMHLCVYSNSEYRAFCQVRRAGYVNISRRRCGARSAARPARCWRRSTRASSPRSSSRRSRRRSSARAALRRRTRRASQRPRSEP